MADYKKVSEIAAEFILREGINSLPVDPVKIIRRRDLGPVKVGHLSATMRCSRQEVHNLIRNDDAGVVLYDGGRCIVYEEKKRPYGRIRWNLAHELGHVELGHTDECLKFGGIDNVPIHIYNKWEIEAHFFAAEILSPLPVLHAFKVSEIEDIMKLCGLSRKAAEKRFEFMRDNTFQSDGWDYFTVHQCFADYIRLNTTVGV